MMHIINKSIKTIDNNNEDDDDDDNHGLTLLKQTNKFAKLTLMMT